MRWWDQQQQGIFAAMGEGCESTYYLRSGENMRPPAYKFVHAVSLNSSSKLNHKPQREETERATWGTNSYETETSRVSDDWACDLRM
ncbi:Protein of unknown function [Gryllus bimaculatus]|nr:Protein of unknown function [Gryllus bimaculatus]